MPKEIDELWEKGKNIKDLGAELIDISLPHTKYALPLITLLLSRSFFKFSKVRWC